jgi:hypothetical protein
MSIEAQTVSGLVDPPVHGIIVYTNSLITPRRFERNGKPEGEPKYGVRIGLLPDSDDFRRCVAAAKDAAETDLPGRPLKGLTTPWVKGDAMADEAEAKGKNRDAYRGRMWIAAKTGVKYPPKLSALINGKIVEFSEDEAKANAGKFYNGTEALVSIRMKGYEGFGGGVTAYLGSVLSLVRGERIGGGRSAVETFKDVVGKYSNVDPTDTYNPDEAVEGW